MSRAMPSVLNRSNQYEVDEDLSSSHMHAQEERKKEEGRLHAHETSDRWCLGGEHNIDATIPTLGDSKEAHTICCPDNIRNSRM